MSLIQIPKEELEQLKTAIVERDRYIVWADEAIKMLKDSLDTQLGYNHFQTMLFAKTNERYLKVVRKQNLSPEDLAKIDGEIEKNAEHLSKVTSNYQVFMREHPLVAKSVLGEYGLKLPDATPPTKED